MAIIDLQATSLATSVVTNVGRYQPQAGDIVFLPDPVQVTLSTTLSSWQNADVSSIVPAGYAGVLLLVRPTTNVDVIWGTRAVGSTDTMTCYVGFNVRAMAVAKLDGSRVFQVWRNNLNFAVHVVAYFNDNVVTLFTNAVEITTPSPGSWQTVDFSSAVVLGELPIGVIVDHIPLLGGTGSPAATDNPFGIQPTDQFFIDRKSLTTHTFWIQRCVNNQIRLYRTNVNAKSYLRGYFKRGIGFYTGQPQITVVAGNAYQSAPALGNGRASGGLYHGFATSGGFNGDARKLGSSFVAYQFGVLEYQPQMPTATNSSGVAEVRLSSATPQLYQMAWFLNSYIAGAITSTSTVTGALGRNRSVTSLVTSTSAVNGALTLTRGLRSNVASSSTVTASLRKNNALASVVTSTTTVTALLGKSYRLGSVVVTSTSVIMATLLTMASMTVVIASVSLVTGTLQSGMPGQVIYLMASDMGGETGQDFVIFRGNRRLLEFKVITSTGIPARVDDLPGIWWRARRSEVNPALVISKALGSGITVESNVCRVSINPLDTVNLVGAYYFELIFESANSLVVASTGRMYVQQSTW